MLAQEHSADSLNNLPLWRLEAFCREWRVSVTIEDGKVTEIISK